MKLDELETTVKKYMLLADVGIIKLLCAFTIAARLPIQPPWLFIVGASSGGKSMLLKALQKCNGTVPLDDLTANTFISGMQKKDQETSLLDRLMPNSILIFKDFTTVISKDKESKGIVIGQMRKIYDGDISKNFGNGKVVQWKGKLSVLAGVTSKVFTTMHQFADMGERFLMYVFEQPDRIAVGMAAAEQLDKRPGEEAMQDAFKTFIDDIKIPKDLPTVDMETKREIVELAELTTRARSAVERNMYSREKEIIQVHFLEMTGRFTSQLMALAMGLIVVNNGRPLTEDDKKLLYKVALDSIPNVRRACLEALTKFKQVETAGIALALKYPPNSVRLHLQDLAAVGMIDWTRADNNRDKWELHNKYRKTMAKFKGVEMTDEILTGLDEDMEMEEEVFAKPVDPEAQRIADIFGGEVIQ